MITYLGQFIMYSPTWGLGEGRKEVEQVPGDFKVWSSVRRYKLSWGP